MDTSLWLKPSGKHPAPLSKKEQRIWDQARAEEWCSRKGEGCLEILNGIEELKQTELFQYINKVKAVVIQAEAQEIQNMMEYKSG